MCIFCTFEYAIMQNNLKCKFMKRVLFINTEGKNVFILTKLKKLILPEVGHWVTWSGIIMLIKKIEHDYDSETIIVTVEI